MQVSLKTVYIKCITVGNGALTTILVIWIPRNPIYQQGIQGWFDGELKLVDLSARVENLSARLLSFPFAHTLAQPAAHSA